MPIGANNYAALHHERMHEVIRKTRYIGLGFAAGSILIFEIFAGPVSRAFSSTSGNDAQTALQTVACAAAFLRIRCLASPVQFINYNTSFCMQGMGKGKATLLHATVRQLAFYIPIMFIMDLAFAIQAIHRWSGRHYGDAGDTRFGRWIDAHYDDAYMKDRFIEWRFMDHPKK